jgi:multicomponent Na+:H+ antiporter subunit A
VTVALAGGIVVAPFADLAADAATVTYAAAVSVDPAYHLDARAENLMALAAWALGALVLAAGPLRAPVVAAVARAGDAVGPRRVYGALLRGINRLSDRVHDTEVRDLRNSLAAIMVPGGLLIAIALVVAPTRDTYALGTVEARDLPTIALLALAVLAGFTAARGPGRLRPVLAVSVLGFALAAVYAATGAPDVALVAVVVETVMTLVFVGVFSRLPRTRRASEHRHERGPRHERRNAIAGFVAGVGAFVTIWAALSRPSSAGNAAAEHVRLAPDAHGGDVVTVILADFRGLDTMVEITVLLVAIAGVASLLGRGRAW